MDKQTGVLFRLFVILICIVITFFLSYNLKAVEKNRRIGYDIQAVDCANLKGHIISLTSQNINNDYMSQVFINECTTGKILEDYPNVGK